MRPKSLILLALALGCGLVASIGISQVMDSRRAEPEPQIETQLVLVAMMEIDRNTELSAQNIQLEAVPIGMVPPGAIATLEEVEGHRPGTKIRTKQIIVGSMLGSGENVRAASQIPEGMRSVAVRVDNTSGAGLIRPGDRVDVQLYARRNPAAGIMDAGTWTILQDVSVFAVDAVISDDENNESLAAKTISLLVDPEQSAKLTLASEVGTIRLVLRNLTDKTEAETFNIGIPELLGQTEKLGEKSDSEKSDGNLSDFLTAQETPVGQASPQVNASTPVRRTPPVDEWQIRIFSGTDVRVDRFINGESANRQSGSEFDTPGVPVGPAEFDVQDDYDPAADTTVPKFDLSGPESDAEPEHDGPALELDAG